MKRFNIRVYGIHIEDSKLLITDEIRFGISMTKLPGGGLQFDEGLEAALKREFQEELQCEIEVGDIFYVNPFLQISNFRETDEVMCMYFWVKVKSPMYGRFTSIPMDFPTQKNDQQVFRWIDMDKLSEDHFTFPIDKAMSGKLKKWWNTRQLP